MLFRLEHCFCLLHGGRCYLLKTATVLVARDSCDVLWETRINAIVASLANLQVVPVHARHGELKDRSLCYIWIENWFEDVTALRILKYSHSGFSMGGG